MYIPPFKGIAFWILMLSLMTSLWTAGRLQRNFWLHWILTIISIDLDILRQVRLQTVKVFVALSLKQWDIDHRFDPVHKTKWAKSNHLCLLHYRCSLKLACWDTWRRWGTSVWLKFSLYCRPPAVARSWGWSWRRWWRGSNTWFNAKDLS